MPFGSVHSIVVTVCLLTLKSLIVCGGQGVAFQGLDEAQNIGYVIPVTVVQHVLYDIQRHGRYTGFCTLGLSLVWLENKSFRKSLGMMKESHRTVESIATDSKISVPKNLSGVMVKEIDPTSCSKGVLLPNDVLLEIDGIPVANDGKVPFRPGERVACSCYIQTKFIGDNIRLKILRDGQILPRPLECKIHPVKRLVPSHFNNQPPPYLIVAGMVFTVLSIPYLDSSGAWDHYQSDQLSYLLGLAYEPLQQESDQTVILSQVLAHRENLGYDKLTDLHLEKVNGEKVRSLAHLKTLIENESGDQQVFLRFEFQPKNVIVVLERSQVHQSTLEVCKEQNIQYPFYLGP
jgi:hypothetical protein